MLTMTVVHDTDQPVSESICRTKIACIEKETKEEVQDNEVDADSLTVL